MKKLQIIPHDYKPLRFDHILYYRKVTGGEIKSFRISSIQRHVDDSLFLELEKIVGPFASGWA